MVVSLVLVALLGLSMFGHLARWIQGVGGGVVGGSQSARWLQESVVKDNRSSDKIVLIELLGAIMGPGPAGKGWSEFLDEQLKMAARDRAVKAVVLKIDSPGGEVLAADNMYRALHQFQVDTGKPVIASMGSLAASGGYYVAAPCRWIVAHELSITGSIGVIMHGYNYRGLLTKIGVRPEVFKSGKFKDMLSGDKSDDEISSEEREMVQAMIDETFSRFKEVIVEGRTWANERGDGSGRPLAEDWEEIADGRILSGKQAWDYGLVDALGNLDSAVEKARELASIQSANLVRYDPPISLGNFLRFLGKSEPGTVRLDMNLDLGMEFPRLQAGRTYFLWMP